nr:MAG TPA: ATP dependent DNA helicase [Crassvirales sp.]
MDITISKANGKDAVSLLGLTNDQSKAYDDLIKFINTDFNPNDFKRALSGAAGTGKTYLLKALIKNCGMSYHAIGCSAPTHKACRVMSESIRINGVNVNTLQSDLGLKINFDAEKFDINNPPFDPKGRIKIGEYKLYIIDEASMIPRGLCIFLERTCKTNGCKLIYVGDNSQLSPVNEKKSAAFIGIKLYTLKQIVRQEEDNPIKYLLELLRYDIKHKTFSFLNYISKNKVAFDNDNIKGFQVCNEQEFNQIVYNNFNDDHITNNVDFVKIVAYTNNCVSSWNKIVRESIISDADKSVITKNDLIISYVTLVDKFNDTIIKNSEEYIIKDIVNYTHPKYNIKGFMIRFIAIHGGQSTTPLFVVDHKDRTSVLQYINISNNLIHNAKVARPITRSQRWKEYFEFKESCLLLTNILDNTGKIMFSRDLDYGFAVTSHKSQGSTYDTALVDVNDIVYDKFSHPYTDAEEINRRLYVACSRCKNKLYLKFGQ